MTQSTPPEERGSDPTFNQIRQLNRSLTEKVLDKAASDPQWRELLLEDPELAMREANFPETQELQQQGGPQRPREREVVGQRRGGYGYGGYGYGGYGYGYGRQCPWYCRFFTWRWYRSW
jgi:hypothetical protein